MKKIALAVVLSLAASPAFAARTVTFFKPGGGSVSFTRFTSLPFFTNNGDKKVASIFPPFTQSYALSMPGFGNGGDVHAASYNLPALGVLSTAYHNKGKGDTMTLGEKFTNQ